MITDEMLRSSAARSSELFAHTITSDYDPAQQYEPSDLFEKKIRKLFHRAKHPYFYKAIQRIASIFLAAILIGSMYLAVDTEARAAFLDWIKEVYEHILAFSCSHVHDQRHIPLKSLLFLLAICVLSHIMGYRESAVDVWTTRWNTMRRMMEADLRRNSFSRRIMYSYYTP